MGCPARSLCGKRSEPGSDGNVEDTIAHLQRGYLD